MTLDDSELHLYGLDALQSTTLAALSVKLTTRFSVLLTFLRTLYPPEKATNRNDHLSNNEYTRIWNLEVLDLHEVENVRAMQRRKTPLGKEHIKLISAQLYATQKRMLRYDSAELDQPKPFIEEEATLEIIQLSEPPSIKNNDRRTCDKMKYLLHRFTKSCYVRNPQIQDRHSFYDLNKARQLETSTCPTGIISEDYGCDILDFDLLHHHLGLHVGPTHLASVKYEIDPLSTGWISLSKLKAWVEIEGPKHRSAWLIMSNLVREMCGSCVGAYERDSAEVILLSGRRRARLERRLLLHYMPSASSPPTSGHPLTDARGADRVSVSVSSGPQDQVCSLTALQAEEIVDELCSLTADSAACESILVYRNINATAVAKQRGAGWWFHESYRALKEVEALGDAAKECMAVAADYCSCACPCVCLRPRCSADDKDTSLVRGCEELIVTRSHGLTSNIQSKNPKICAENDSLDFATDTVTNTIGNEVISKGGPRNLSECEEDISAEVEVDLRSSSKKELLQSSSLLLSARDSACADGCMCTVSTNRILMACRLADVFNLGHLSWREVSVCLRYLGCVVDNLSEGETLYLLPALSYRRVRYNEVVQFVKESVVPRSSKRRAMTGMLDCVRKHLGLRSLYSSMLTKDHFLLSFQNKVTYNRKCEAEEFWNLCTQDPSSSNGNVKIKSLIEESREKDLSLFMTHIDAMKNVALEVQGGKENMKIKEEMKRIASIEEQYPRTESLNEVEHFIRLSFRVFAVHETLLQFSEIPYLLHFCVQELLTHSSEFYKSNIFKANEVEVVNRIKWIGEEKAVHFLLPLLTTAHTSLKRENQGPSFSKKTNNTDIAICSLKSAARQAAVLAVCIKVAHVCLSTAGFQIIGPLH